MKKTEFYNEIEDVLGVNRGTINPDMIVKDQSFWDSMAIMSFMAMVEEEFTIVLDNDQIKQAHTFGDLAKLLEGKLTE
jgi:acyl carrier protein